MIWPHLKRLLLVFAIFGLVWSASVIAKPELIEAVVVAEPTDCEADAMVVMAGSQTQRLPSVVKLYRQGCAPRILLTNDGVLGAWSREQHRNFYQVEWARQFLLDEGIPEQAIVMLGFSRSGSYYDALNTRTYALADGSIDKLLIVTSDYHTGRSLWVFCRLFSDMNVRIGVYPIVAQSKSTLYRLRNLTMELIKFGYYRLRYG